MYRFNQSMTKTTTLTQAVIQLGIENIAIDYQIHIIIVPKV